MAMKTAESTTRSLSIRERRRLDLISELKSIAMRLFASNGYQNTSLQEISDEAGISLRTLFRHVSSKDQLLDPSPNTWDSKILVALRERPKDEDVLTAYKGAIATLVAEIEADRGRALAVLQIIDSDQDLRIESWDVFGTHTLTEIYDELGRRMNLPRDSREVKFTRALLLTAVAQSLKEWSEDPSSTDLKMIVERNIEVLRPALRALAPDARS